PSLLLRHAAPGDPQPGGGPRRDGVVRRWQRPGRRVGDRGGRRRRPGLRLRHLRRRGRQAVHGARLRILSASVAGRPRRRGRDGEPEHDRRPGGGRARADALAGERQGDPDGLDPGRRRGHRDLGRRLRPECQRQRGRSRRPPAGDVPRERRRRPDGRRSREVPGRGRECVLQGGRPGRLPLVRCERHRAGLRLRPRPLVHRLRLRRARRRAHPEWRSHRRFRSGQRGRAAGQRRGAGLRRLPHRGGARAAAEGPQRLPEGPARRGRVRARPPRARRARIRVLEHRRERLARGARLLSDTARPLLARHPGDRVAPARRRKLPVTAPRPHAAMLLLIAVTAAGAEPPPPLSADQTPADIASTDGSGSFGTWIVDRFGLPAYRYEIDEETAPQAAQPELGGKRHAWHQVGNDHIVANAYNHGYVQLWSQDRLYQWINFYDAAHDHFAGGFGYLNAGGQVSSTLYDDRPAGAVTEREFGVGYYRRRMATEGIEIEEFVYAPFGDDPLLLHDVTIRNPSAASLEASWFEYWDVNPEIQAETQFPRGYQSPVYDPSTQTLT